MRRLRHYGMYLAHLVPLLFLLYSYSPLPHPDTVFYNMPSPLLQNKNILPLPSTLSTKIYVPVYLKSYALLKHFLPILTQRGPNPNYSSQTLFESHYESYTGYTRQIYELSLYLTLQKDLTRFLTQYPAPTPYTPEGLAAKLRTQLDTELILGIDNNPLYFKTQLQPMLQTLLQPMPDSATRTALLTPEFAIAVVFPSDTIAIPPLPYPNLPAHQRTTHLKDMAESINWRLLIAGNKQKIETPLIFDNREPGCLVAMAQAFKYAIRTLDEPLSLQKVITVHQLCVEKINNSLNDYQKKHSTQPFRQNPNPAGFSMISPKETNMTPAGKRELCLYENIDKDYTLRDNYLQTCLYDEPLKDRMETILAQYNHNMAQAHNPQQKLQYIVSTLSLLERIHPFWDANCRTFCTVLLNSELLRHGFPVTVLEDPNYCDGYSTPEFMQEVVNGFTNYHYVKEHGHFMGEPIRKIDPANQKLIAQLKAIFLEAADATP